MAKTGKKGLTVRGKAMRWMSTHRGITEQPSGSNRDNRADGIAAAQKRLAVWLVGLAWCGVWVANALLFAGVEGVSWRLASVNWIEDAARRGDKPFRDWLAPTFANLRRCLRGDLVVLLGRGVHVGMLRAIKYVKGIGWVLITEEGNTSSGNLGSQSNGGGSYRRERPLTIVHGLARVDFPGGPAKVRKLTRVAAFAGASIYAQAVGTLLGHDVEPDENHNFYPHEMGSDAKLLLQLHREHKGGLAGGDEQLAELEQILTAGPAR